MSEFNNWFYVTDKCDTRFDHWTENRHSYYYAKEAWDYKEKEIQKLKKVIELYKKSNDFYANDSNWVRSFKLARETQKKIEEIMG